jgi:uncharacterized protein (DUF924 family)
MTSSSESVLEFWFGDDLESPEVVEEFSSRWFAPDASFDALIRERFGDLPARAHAGEFDSWREEPRSGLALVLILDQFPRNLYRGTAQCFAYDSAALKVAEEALGRRFDDALAPVEAAFLYLPLEHSEDLARQDRCVALYRSLLDRVSIGLRPRFEAFLAYALRHREVIGSFGRFHHRNALLGRSATSAEQSYLESGGDTFGGGRSDDSR